MKDEHANYCDMISEYPVMKWAECKMRFEHIESLRDENKANPHIEAIKSAVKEITGPVTIDKIDSYLTKHNLTIPEPFLRQYTHNRQTIDGIGQLIAKGSLRLVLNVVKRFMGSGVPWSDLLSIGNMALMKSISDFKVRLGIRWCTYAYCCVRSQIMGSTELRKSMFSTHVTSTIRQVAKAREKLGGDPDPATISDWINKHTYAKVSVKTVEKCIPLIEQERVNVKYQVAPDVSEHIDDKLDGLHMAELAKEWLTSRSYRVMQLRYGLDGVAMATLQDIGDELGCTRERVRQIETKCLQIIRHISETGCPPEYSPTQLHVRPEKYYRNKQVQEAELVAP